MNNAFIQIGFSGGDKKGFYLPVRRCSLVVVKVKHESRVEIHPK